MTNYFTTIQALLNNIAERGLPAQLHACGDGFKLCFPWYEGGDIACNTMTGGRLESYGFPWDYGDTTRDTLDGLRRRLVALWEEATY